MKIRPFWFLQGIAMLVVLLHSMLPHDHLEDNNSASHLEEHQEASSLIEYIILGFHHQQVEGDMEHFSPSTPLDDVQLEPDFVCFALIHFNLLPTQLTQENQSYSLEEPHFSSPEEHFKSHARRGPPSLFA